MPLRHMLMMLISLISTMSGTSPVVPQWQPQNSTTDADLRGVSAVSAGVAWASGTKGTVLRTVDGGKSWETVSVPGAETLDFRDIQAFDTREAFVLSCGPGEQSRIYQTMDGGRHWRLQFTNPEARAFYDGFAFRDRKHGIAMSDSVEGKFPLLVTDDGVTWKPLAIKTLPTALPDEGGFAASGTCIAVSGKSDAWFVTGGPAARVFHSTDEGVNWEVVNSPIISGAPTQGIFSVAFADEHNGMIVGGDYKAPKSGEKNAAYTRDGGKTWTLANTFPAGYRSAVAFIPGSSPLIWVTVGTSGSDYSLDGGKTWLPFDTGDYNAVSFAGPRAGWAVGPKGRIARLIGIP
jgi:photosystem II stability/assembly factor-like uncharacterized protein